MKIKVYRNVSKTERFPCTTKDIKNNKFSEMESLHVSFGLRHKFSFDSYDRYRYSNLPDIKGHAIAMIIVIGSSRKGAIDIEYYNLTDCSIYLYPIKIEVYPESAIIDFRDNILPFIYSWLVKQTNKRDNERLIDSKLIIEWFENKHQLHDLKPK